MLQPHSLQGTSSKVTDLETVVEVDLWRHLDPTELLLETLTGTFSSRITQGLGAQRLQSAFFFFTTHGLGAHILQMGSPSFFRSPMDSLSDLTIQGHGSGLGSRSGFFIVQGWGAHT